MYAHAYSPRTPVESNLGFFFLFECLIISVNRTAALAPTTTSLVLLTCPFAWHAPRASTIVEKEGVRRPVRCALKARMAHSA
jgi:hypothetical protein